MLETLKSILCKNNVRKGDTYYYLVANAEAALPGMECRHDATGAEDFFYQFGICPADVIGFSDSAEIDEDYAKKSSGAFVVIFNGLAACKMAIPAKHFTKDAPIYERYLRNREAAQRYCDLANEHERRLMEIYNTEHGTALKFARLPWAE